MDELLKDDFEDLGNLSLVLEGKPENFSKIVVKYEKLIFKLAHNFLGKNGEIEDAVQDIFLETYKSLANFKLGRRFLPWLYSIALNVLRKKYRTVIKLRKTRETLQRLDLPEETDPLVLVERQAAQQAIRDAVLSLPETLREVIVLYYMENLSVNEICAILEVGEENVKSRLFRARKKLRNLLTNVQLFLENGQ